MLRRFRLDLIAILILIVVVLLFFWQYALTAKILPRGDAFIYFYPYWDYKHEVMRNGQLPLWNPYLFMGVPFLANSQAGVLYPPNWLLIPFSAPVAVKLALLSHISWAAVGMYAFARRSLMLHPMPAILAGLVFSLSGYLGAQVEHVNQIQGMAWIPFLFLVWSEIVDHRRYRLVALLAVLFALQLLAGHTQSAFISGVGLGVYALYVTLRRWAANERTPVSLTLPLGSLAGASIVSLGLAAGQLLPTLELTSLSHRGGGLSALEAVSFSLQPLLLGRTLLPDFTPGPLLFSEYVAYLGVSVLLLIVIGVFAIRPKVTGVFVVMLLGLVLAFGAYNPVYWFLVNLVPGFDLFRAPARWLLLFVFGSAGLAGIGLEAILASEWSRKLRLSILFASGLIALLGVLSFLTSVEAQPGIGIGEPRSIDIVIWLLVFFISLAILLIDSLKAYRVTLLTILVALELFLAAHAQPYNRVSSPLVWTTERQAISVLEVAQGEREPGGRMLSISETFFDPGDLAEINVVYGDRLSEQELADYIIGTKQKEILSPNLPLAWEIYSIDGFDGGLLPTAAYIDYTALFLPEDVTATDGRLREYLPAAPPLDYLAQSNVQFLITDKVFDAWVDGTYHDLQFPQQLTAYAEPWEPFVATGMSVIATDNRAEAVATAAGQLTIITTDGEAIEVPLSEDDAFDPSLTEYRASLVFWGQSAEVESISVTLDPGVMLRGITLIDTRSNAFMPTVLTPSDNWHMALLHAADIKIYDLVSSPPRIRVVCAADVQFVETVDNTWELLPQETVIVGTEPGTIACIDNIPSVDVIEYRPEEVVVALDDIEAGHILLITDANYPGWQATVDGEQTDILVANGMFRAVSLGEGAERVVMSYRSKPFERGMQIGAITWIACLFALTFQKRRKG